MLEHDPATPISNLAEHLISAVVLGVVLAMASHAVEVVGWTSPLPCSIRRARPPPSAVYATRNLQILCSPLIVSIGSIARSALNSSMRSRVDLIYVIAVQRDYSK
jgi:hypothetical protein